MGDYPQTFTEFESQFSSEAACAEYLAQIRWPDGFACPSCGGRKAWKTGRLLFHCAGCGRQISLTAGTIFQGTRKSLRMWFRAIWSVTNREDGTSAKELQRDLGLSTYRTAWAWLHKLRRAMVHPHRERLSGVVGVGELYVGGRERNQDVKDKTPVFVAFEKKKDEALGRIRMAVVSDVSQDRMRGFIYAFVDPEATVLTENWVNRILSSGTEYITWLLERRLRCTHQNFVSPTHLPYYLDEFTFRFNHRELKAPGKLFFLLLRRAAAIRPAPYKTLTKPTTTHRGHLFEGFPSDPTTLMWCHGTAGKELDLGPPGR